MTTLALRAPQVLLALLLLAGMADAQSIPPADAAMQSIMDQTAATVLQRFAERPLKPEQLAITLVDLHDPAKPARGSYRGAESIYPASVIKLFYLAAAHQWMEEGKLADTPELRRAMSDMIVHSYNEATHYIIDLLTGTTSGPELPEAEIDAWFEKRNAVNRYFTSLGYTNVVANKKPWCEGPYGRESQSIRRHKPNRNALTTDATARLLTEIVTGRAVTAKRSAEMLALLKRDPSAKTADPDHQATAYSAPGLPRDTKLWSKAGWTSEVRHDAACVELPDGRRFVLVIYTTGHSEERDIIGAIAREIVNRFPARR